MSRLRASAGPDTKLLIGDMLLPFACHDDSSPESSFAPKDSPLLPNLGKGNVHGYLIDIMVRSNEDVHTWGTLQVFEVCMYHLMAEHIEIQVVLIDR